MTDIITPDSTAEEPAAEPKTVGPEPSTPSRRVREPAALRLASETELAIVAHALSLESEAPDLFETQSRSGDEENSAHLGPRAALVLASAVRRRLAEQGLGIANRNPRQIGKLLRRSSV